MKYDFFHLELSSYNIQAKKYKKCSNTSLFPILLWDTRYLDYSVVVVVIAVVVLILCYWPYSKGKE